MPDISITDNLGSPVDGVKPDFSKPSSLVDYAKSQALHLLVAPDFIARKDEPLTQAAPKSVRFQAKVANAFSLGTTQPALTLTPKVDGVLRANTSAGANLFDDDTFHVQSDIPAGTGYAGLALTGAMELGAAATAGDFSFGMKAGGSVAIEYLKAFPTGAGEPTLGAAVAQMISGYVIPARMQDLARLQPGDICTVAGHGSLQVSGGFQVTTPVNPLASVNLPLNVGTLNVKSGVMAGVSARFTLSGSYQIRVRRLSKGAIELSYLRERGTRLEADFNVAASASANFNSTDLAGALLGAICKDTPAAELRQNLKPEEAEAFNAAVKEGVAHSVQASLDVVLSSATEGQAAFQYEIDLDALDAASTDAVARALHGDLTGMTALEEAGGTGGVLAPGVRLLDSVLVRARTTGITLKVNLLGIVNLVSLEKLIGNCEILTEPASGDLTIKETAQSERLGAITNQLHRQEALRKALFESVMATTTYRAGKAVALPDLACECLHFVINRGTAPANVRDYLTWFAALKLIPQVDAPSLLLRYGGDATSTCVLRAIFDDAACEQLFLDGGKLRPKSYYLDYAREALCAMLATSVEVLDRARYAVLDDPARWKQAIDEGPTPALRPLIPLDERDPHFDSALALVIGDIYDIAWWAESMCDAGKALLAMREYLNGREAAGLAGDSGFQQRRDALQKTMLKVVANSKARFDQPWGLVALYWAAGSPGTASGKITAGGWTLARPT